MRCPLYNVHIHLMKVSKDWAGEAAHTTGAHVAQWALLRSHHTAPVPPASLLPTPFHSTVQSQPLTQPVFTEHLLRARHCARQPPVASKPIHLLNSCLWSLFIH